MEDGEQSDKKPNTNLPESISSQLYQNSDQKTETSKQPPARPISEVINTPSRPKTAEQKHEASTKVNENNQKSTKSDKQKTSIAPKIAIFLAVLVMIGLSVIAVYGYTSSKENSNDSVNTNSTKYEDEATKNPDISSIDNSKKQLEEAVKEIDQLPSDSDDSGENIADQDIGL